jgi:NitT/TauT family transport system substrate-binding protein
MADQSITRRNFGLSAAGLTAASALPGLMGSRAFAADTVRHGIQIGALGALRTTVPDAGKKYDLAYDIRDFPDSTAVLLAIEQGALDIGNTTSQHLVRAISEGIPVTWISGWGGGYNVLVARKDLGLKPNDPQGLKALVGSRKQSGKPLSIGVPTGSLQNAKLAVYLKSIGVDPDKDVQVSNIPFPAHPRALQAGEVDMAMTLSGFGALAINKGDAYLYLHLFGGPFGKQEVGFLVSQKFIREKPELVQRIVQSHADAMNLFIGKPDMQVKYEKAYSRLPDPVIEINERQFLQYNYRTNVADIKTMARELRDLGWVKDDYSTRVDDYIDLRFLTKATGLSTAELSHW